MATISNNSASARLLATALESGSSLSDLARVLAVAPDLVEDYVSVRERMPIAAQLALANWAEQHLPAQATRARRLRAQASAAAAMERGDTIRHSQPPHRA